jgi:uncharacterized DUF497 family protein
MYYIVRIAIDMRFVWDDRKNRTNKLKHGISFELARLVFEDPQAISLPDDFEKEERWLTVGRVKELVALLVVHTLENEDDEEVIRIISARRATRHETKAYENQHKKP